MEMSDWSSDVCSSDLQWFQIKNKEEKKKQKNKKDCPTVTIEYIWPMYIEQIKKIMKPCIEPREKGYQWKRLRKVSPTTGL